MVGYAELSKMNTFTLNDVCNLVGNKNCLFSLVKAFQEGV